MTGRGRLLGAVAAVVVAAAVLTATTPGLEVATRVAAPRSPAATPTTGPPTTAAPPSSPSTTPTTRTTEAPAAGGPGDAGDVAECLAGDLLHDPDILLGDGDITGAAPEQVARIADAVEEERELTFREEVEPEFVTGEEIARRVRDLSAGSYPPAEADVDDRLLTALGAIPPDLDLREAVLDLTAGQVAGYYEPSSGDLVVLAEDPGRPLGPAEQVTLAHELDHALTDQRLDHPDVDEDPAADDAAIAASALVEGDATVLMQRFALAHVGIAGLTDAAGEGGDQDALADVPAFLRSNLTFPYLDGMAFVCSLLAAGGWEAVDAAYDDPPTTTAEVLFPERYGEAAREAPAVASPGEGWEEVAREPFGAAPLRWLLEAPGGDASAPLADAGERTAAWGGDEVAVFTRGEATAVGLSLVAHEGADPGELCTTMADWYRASFPDAAGAPTEGDEAMAVEGDRQSAVVACSGDAVALGIAPDLATARALLPA